MSVFDELASQFDGFLQLVGEPVTYRKGSSGETSSVHAVVRVEDGGLTTQGVDTSEFYTLSVAVQRDPAQPAGGVAAMEIGDQILWDGHWWSFEGDIVSADSQFVKGRFMRGEPYSAGGQTNELPVR